MEDYTQTLESLTNQGNTLFGKTLIVKIDNENKELIIKKRPLQRTYKSRKFIETFLVNTNEDIDSYCIIPFRGWIHSNHHYLDCSTENFIVKNSVNSQNNNFIYNVSIFIHKLNENLC